MTSVNTEQQYRSPADVVEKQRELLGIPASQVLAKPSPQPLVGTWMNVNHSTTGLIRLMIAANGNEITVHGFGACTPSPCDWGQVNGLVYAQNVTSAIAVAFSATYTFGFKTTNIVGRLQDGALFVETYDHFTDNSGRSDYYSMNIMTQ